MSSLSTEFHVGDWLVECDAGELSNGGQRIRLEPKAMEVLCYLASRPGEVVSREELERDVWKGAIIGYDSVSVAVTKLRKAFGDDAANPSYIATVPKRGYRLVAYVDSTSRRGIADSPQVADPVATGRSTGIQGRSVIVGLLLAVVVVGLVLFGSTRVEQVSPNTASVAEENSIVVLPFNNLSQDTEQDYFADGITEDLTTDLSKISSLFVIARNTAFTYKGRRIKAQTLAEELGVRYVLEGSVRRAGESIRVNAQLIDAETGGHVWAERYDGSSEDIFALQDKMTSKIVATLAIKLTQHEEEQLYRRETEDEVAYETFLKGWGEYTKQTPEGFRRAIELFRQALDLDPDYARAYAALALTHWQAWQRYWFNDLLGPAGTPHELRALAENYLVQAMRAPTPLALQVAAAMHAQWGRYEEAVTQGESAIGMNPNNADGYVALAGALNIAGKPNQALPLIEKAMRLNPHYPSSYLYELGLARFGLDQYEAAVTALERAVAINSSDRWSSRLLIAALGHLGRAEDIEPILASAEENWRGFDPLTVRGVTYWYPFKRAADTERLAQGLRSAGLPD